MTYSISLSQANQLSLPAPSIMAKLATVHEQVSRLITDEVVAGNWKVYSKPDSSFVTDIDLFADVLLAERLSKLIAVPVLSEERTKDFEELKPRSSFWLIDPIDNTRGLVEQRNLSQSRINYAYFQDGYPLIGMVGFFNNGEAVSSHSYEGTFRYNGNVFERLSIQPVDSKVIRFSTYRSKLEEMSERTQSFFRKFEPESISLKGYNTMTERFMALVRGEADVYIEPRSLPWWDISPYLGMVQAQGGTCESLDPSLSLRCFGTTLWAPPFLLARAGVKTKEIMQRIRLN